MVKKFKDKTTSSHVLALQWDGLEESTSEMIGFVGKKIIVTYRPGQFPVLSFKNEGLKQTCEIGESIVRDKEGEIYTFTIREMEDQFTEVIESNGAKTTDKPTGEGKPASKNEHLVFREVNPSSIDFMEALGVDKRRIKNLVEAANNILRKDRNGAAALAMISTLVDTPAELAYVSYCLGKNNPMANTLSALHAILSR